MTNRVQNQLRLASLTGLAIFALGTNVAHATNQSLPPESRIYGGEKAGSCEWPTAIGFGSCSGTLVHPQLVIYAAHCGKQSKISFGDAYKSMHRTVKPKFCKTNPDYKGNGSLGKGVDYAYCYLEEPITDFPITPVAYGCELDQIKAGTKIWLVGFGETDSLSRGYGVKHKVETTIREVKVEGRELKVGGDGKATCYGDSGGPGYVKLSDGTWRHVAISSFGYGECGNSSGMTFSQAGVPWIHKSLKAEGITDVDITPCYNDEGEWEPTKECKGFATEPGKAHGDWESSCGGDKAPRSGFSSICGPAAGENPDDESGSGESGDDDDQSGDQGLEIDWVSPEDGAKVKVGKILKVMVKVKTEAEEYSVTLKVDGKEQDTLKKGPFRWSLEDLEVGEHTLVAVTTDGENEASTKERTIEVVDGSEESESSEPGESNGDSDGEEPEEGDTDGETSDSGASNGSADGKAQDGELKDSGCAIDPASGQGLTGMGLFVLLGGLVWRRKNA